MEKIEASFAKLIRQESPEKFLVDSIRIIFGAYKSARVEVFSDYDGKEAEDLLPVVRRAKIEKGLRGIAKKHKLEVKQERNEAKNCWHNEIICGKILFTQSFVKSPYAMPQSANFRETLARANQLDFFLYSKISLGDFYYAILLHGSSTQFPEFPDFVRIGFPAENCEQYVDEPIDLMKLCNLDGATLGLNIEEEKIDDDMVPEFLPPSDIGKGERA